MLTKTGKDKFKTTIEKSKIFDNKYIIKTKAWNRYVGSHKDPEVRRILQALPRPCTKEEINALSELEDTPKEKLKINLERTTTP